MASDGPFLGSPLIEATAVGARTCTAPVGGGSAPPLVVATHQALLRFLPQSGCFVLLSGAAAGHYYSAVASDAMGLPAGGLLVGSQALGAAGFRNASGMPAGDALVFVGDQGASWAWSLPTVYLHDSLHDDATGDVFSVDSIAGHVLQLNLSTPPSPSSPAAKAGTATSVPPGTALSVRRRLAVVGKAEARGAHINGLTLDPHRLWVLHHNMGRASEVHVHNRRSGAHCAAYTLAGPSCHGATWYLGRLLYLLSNVGGIAALSADGRSSLLWSAG